MPALRRLTGAALLAAAFAPLHRLLDPAVAGPAAAATRAATDTAWILALTGTLIVCAFAWVFSRLVPAQEGEATPARWAERLNAPAAGTFALGTGLLAAGLATTIALFVHGGAPTSVDEMAQLLDARTLLAGRLALPIAPSPASWIVQNGVVVDGGWVSVYPPMHTLLLALGLAAGAPWAVGPVALGVATGCVTRSAEALAGATVGRSAGLLLAVSPFWLLLGATASSHATAAMGLCMLILAAERARSGGSLWACAAGAALGFAVSARPWMGLACGAAILAALWGSGARARPEALVRRLAAAAAGGAPFAALLFVFDWARFGSPLRLGYTAAFGPAHGLGFHPDPWGNRYSPLEALAYTGSDLLQLGVHLFESPVPALAVVGAVLLLRALPRGASVFAAWAAAGVGANALYWHHGLHFGPRMLLETAPAWVVLFTMAAATVLAPGPAGRGTRFARWAVVVAIVGGLALTPGAILAPRAAAGGVELPPLPTTPAVVFVHGSWSSRVSAKLAAAGMRRDSIETALRRNDACAVDRYARWRAGREATEATLDFTPLPGPADHLATRVLSEGNMVRIDPSASPDGTCAREARSDRFGVLDLEPVAWRHPPLPNRAVWVARDLGPAGNLPLLVASDRTPFLLVRSDAGGMLLLDYDEGMEMVWGGAAGEAR